MKILRLKAENTMRLVAIDISPEGHLITIGGKNSAGKSSVLNSIAMALGGATMAPVEPIRKGETEAKISLDLGDLIVTRRFTRDRLPCDCGADVESVMHGGATFKHKAGECASLTKFGDTKSTIVVQNRDGAKYPSPQAMLDKLLGRLTFDPLAFSRMDPKPQDETLRKLVGLDISKYEEQRKTAFIARAMAKKSYEIKSAQLLALPKHAGVPDTELSLDAVSQEMLKAEELRKMADEAERQIAQLQNGMEMAQRELIRVEGVHAAKKQEIARMQELIRIAHDDIVETREKIEMRQREIEAARITAQAARAVVPDVSVIRAKLSEVEATNQKVRANQKHEMMAEDVANIQRQINDHHQAITNAEQAKRDALAAAKFPVPGLGLDDNGVVFRGLPFSQASSSEQLRVSVAIGLSLNPTLKVLLIRSGNLLDDDSLKLVAEQAEKADAQLWVEWVTSDAGKVQVMIEDGSVKS